MYRTQLDATTSGQSGSSSDANEERFRIPQSSSITGTSQLDCSVSYQDTRWGRSYLSTEK